MAEGFFLTLINFDNVKHRRFDNSIEEIEEYNFLC